MVKSFSICCLYNSSLILYLNESKARICTSKCSKNCILQPICLDFIRSDYMLDDKRGSHVNGVNGVNGHHGKSEKKTKREYEIKQIEVNMIAASFGGLGSLVSKLHRYLKVFLRD